MLRRPPRSTRTYTLFPSSTLFRSLLCALAGGAHDDSVGPREILYRRAFAQELWIGNDIEIGLRRDVPDAALHFVAGADRHGRFGDDNGIAGKRLCDFFRRRMNIAEIGMAVAAPRRCADRDEHCIGAGARIGQRSAEHTSELQSLMRISYAGFCLKTKNNNKYPYKTKQP